MKTLLVKYLPGGADSSTKKLMDLFLDATKGASIETLDLITAKIPFFNCENIQAYYKKHYGAQELSTSEAAGMAEHYTLMNQFKAADVVVMAYPMHNFGMPGRVKSYLDAVMLNGETFSMGQKLMAGKKSLTMFTAGGIYTEDKVDMSYPNWNTLSLLAKINFSFMGFDEAEVIGTSLRDPATAELRLLEMKNRINTITHKWYK